MAGRGKESQLRPFKWATEKEVKALEFEPFEFRADMTDSPPSLDPMPNFSYDDKDPSSVPFGMMGQEPSLQTWISTTMTTTSSKAESKKTTKTSSSDVKESKKAEVKETKKISRQDRYATMSTQDKVMEWVKRLPDDALVKRGISHVMSMIRLYEPNDEAGRKYISYFENMSISQFLREWLSTMHFTELEKGLIEEADSLLANLNAEKKRTHDKIRALQTKINKSKVRQDIIAIDDEIKRQNRLLQRISETIDYHGKDKLKSVKIDPRKWVKLELGMAEDRIFQNQQLAGAMTDFLSEVCLYARSLRIMDCPAALLNDEVRDYVFHNQSRFELIQIIIGSGGGSSAFEVKPEHIAPALERLMGTVRMVFIKLGNQQWTKKAVRKLAQTLAISWSQPACVYIQLPGNNKDIFSKEDGDSGQTYSIVPDPMNSRVEIHMPSDENRVTTKGQYVPCTEIANLGGTSITRFKCNIYINRYTHRVQLTWTVHGSSPFVSAMSVPSQKFDSREVFNIILCYGYKTPHMKEVLRILDETKARSMIMDQMHLLGWFFSRAAHEGGPVYEHMGLYEHLFLRGLGSLSLCYLLTQLQIMGLITKDDMLGLNAGGTKPNTDFAGLVTFYQSLGFITIPTGDDLDEAIKDRSVDMVSTVPRFANTCRFNKRSIDPFVEWYDVTPDDLQPHVDEITRQRSEITHFVAMSGSDVARISFEEDCHERVYPVDDRM